MIFNRYHTFAKFPHLAAKSSNSGIKTSEAPQQFKFNPENTPIMTRKQSQEFTKIIAEQHRSVNAEIDLMMIMDATYSMGDAIEVVKEKLCSEFVTEMHTR